jgi:predicted nucleic-acid-binding Zn-ribbon protein
LLRFGNTWDDHFGRFEQVGPEKYHFWVHFNNSAGITLLSISGYDKEDAMSKKCVKCGSENIEPGKVQSSGRLSFYPDRAKFLSWKTSNVSVLASICLDCGTIELAGDVAKAKDLTDKK